MDGTDEPTGAHGPESQHAGGGDAPRQINVEELAERVYRLMKAEIRLEQARGVTPQRRG